MAEIKDAPIIKEYTFMYEHSLPQHVFYLVVSELNNTFRNAGFGFMCGPLKKTRIMYSVGHVDNQCSYWNNQHV